MSRFSRLVSLVGSTVVLVLGVLALIWLFSPDNRAVIYAASFAVHFINLHAFLFRRDDASAFAARSMLFRTVSIVLIAALVVPTLGERFDPLGLPVLVFGVALHAAAFRALGTTRTYYGAELGAVPPERIDTFPYGWIPHPMAIGCVLELTGLYLLAPALRESYPYLIPGHIALTVLTAIAEHFDWHFRDYFFSARAGTLSDAGVRGTVDRLRNWSLDHFRSHLNRECSMHRYVKTLPEEAVEAIDEVRYADEVMATIRSAFPSSTVVPLPMTDEIYLSRYNYDRGGDQGLFDKHHDGNLRFMPGASVVRSLLYLSSDDHLEVVFDTSGEKKNFKTYDFGLLDFHRELHWVNGSYVEGNPPRILLKCNYYVDHTGFLPYRWLGIGLNVGVFYVVKAAMEYSKSPRTLFQRAVGWLCNLFRRLNNLSPAAPLVLVIAVVAISTKAVMMQFGN